MRALMSQTFSKQKYTHIGKQAHQLDYLCFFTHQRFASKHVIRSSMGHFLNNSIQQLATLTHLKQLMHQYMCSLFMRNECEERAREREREKNEEKARTKDTLRKSYQQLLRSLSLIIKFSLDRDAYYLFPCLRFLLLLFQLLISISPYIFCSNFFFVFFFKTQWNEWNNNIHMCSDSEVLKCPFLSLAPFLARFACAKVLLKFSLHVKCACMRNLTTNWMTCEKWDC